MSVLHAATLGVLLASIGVCQTPTWSLADGQAALFDRTHGRELKALEPASGAGRRPARSQAVPVPHNGGVLFRTDLDAQARTPIEEPRQLLQILPRIAFDLRTFRRGRLRGEFEGLYPLGTLQVRGDAGRPTDDGRQELRLEVRTPEPARGRDAQPPAYELLASLVVRRSFDAGRGLVTDFTATLTGTLSQPGDRAAPKLELRIAETWTFREIAEADSPKLRERVGLAIRSGVDAIRAEVGARLRRIERNPPPEREGHGSDHAVGELALGLLTMVKGGTRRDDELLRRGYAALRGSRLRGTYTIGLTLMAFEALYADPNERDNLIAGRLDRPQPRTPTEEDKALMEAWVARLLDNRDSRVDCSYTSRWTYTGGAGFDNSNTQYALLGLYSAQLCGVEIPTTVWWSASKHFLDQQCPSEGSHPLSLVTRRQLGDDRSARRTRTSTRVDARGWSYTHASAAPYGSMTAAGIASLTICLAGLRDAGVRGGVKVNEIRSAIRGGWAWFARNFRVRDNPGPPQKHSHWRYYYLYGLERACELMQVAQIDSRDWYFEGASILMEMQGAGGKFASASFADNCFAVLFLKKASLPVFTGR